VDETHQGGNGEDRGRGPAKPIGSPGGRWRTLGARAL
jgi:hypothetical protein